MLPVEDMSVEKHGPNFFLKEELENNSEGLIRAKLVGSCLTAAVYFFVFLRYSRSVHPRIEIYMAVFEAPL